MDDSRENGGAILSAEEVQCWSSVKEDPSDFQSWIKLLQLVEQKASHTSHDSSAHFQTDCVMGLYPILCCTYIFVYEWSI